MRGFTALELILVLAVVFLLFAAVAVPFSSYRESQVLNASAEEITSLLNEARASSIASRESSQYGVHFEAARAVFFKGTAWSEPSSYNKEFMIDAAISIASTTLNGGGADIVFEGLTGETASFGTITLQSKRTPSKQKTVTVLQTGAASHD
jgi:Tfp pilus assembly protein FimT